MNQPVKKSKIGGQALIEGVMMRGLDKVAMAVRLPNGTIDLEDWAAGDLVHPKWYRRVPIVRGCVNLVESLKLGLHCIMKSAEKSAMEEDGEEETGSKAFAIASAVGIVLGVVLCLFLFAYLPSLAVKGLSAVIPIAGFRSLIEGVIKIAIFVGYLALISCMKDIKRTYCYHGAEHKSIACYEAGQPLTVDHVKEYSRFHPRCGTSFLLIVLVVSILFFSVVTWENLLLRVVLKVLLLPLVIGISYEIIRLAGKYQNLATRIISAPGLWLQRLTTREPDAQQIEVAIAALKDVLPENPEEDQW